MFSYDPPGAHSLGYGKIASFFLVFYKSKFPELLWIGSVFPVVQNKQPSYNSPNGRGQSEKCRGMREWKKKWERLCPWYGWCIPVDKAWELLGHGCRCLCVPRPSCCGQEGRDRGVRCWARIGSLGFSLHLNLPFLQSPVQPCNSISWSLGLEKHSLVYA